MLSFSSRAAALAVFCLFPVAVVAVYAQQGADKAAAEEPADKPAAESPAGEKPGGGSASDTKEFDDLFTELKDLIVQLNDIRAKYATAEPDEQPALAKSYEQLIARGQSIFPRLGPAAEKSFNAKPDVNGDAAKHLIEMADRSIDEGDTKEGRRLADLLSAKAPNSAAALGLKGRLAFLAGDEKTATEQLNQAAKAGKLSEGAQKVHDELKLREAEAKADDLPRVKLETNQGDIVVELFENQAPNTVANFISLVDKKFYDGLKFHRVIEGFVAQGGDPKGDGTGGPGYAIPCECDPQEHPNHRNHYRGTLSMAHAGPNTGGSQFFLCFGPTPHLDGKHTAFGRVIEGLEVLDKIKRIEPGDPGAPDKIVKATVVRKRDHEYKPKTLPDPRG